MTFADKIAVAGAAREAGRQMREYKPALITPNGGVRCWSCGRRFANTITAPYDVTCRCGASNKDDTSLNIAYSQ